MEKPLIYVTTGTNQYNFNRMLDIVSKCVNSLDGDYELYLQYGSSDDKDIRFKAQSSEFISRGESERLYKEASIIFSHCGIGSIYNSLQYNTPTVIIPRLEKFNEFSDDHQLQIAREVQDNPLIFMVEEAMSDEEISKGMSDFMALHRDTAKQKVDLVNYELANRMKSVFFDEK